MVDRTILVPIVDVCAEGFTSLQGHICDFSSLRISELGDKYDRYCLMLFKMFYF